MGFLPWEIRVAFHGKSQLRQSCATQPTVHAECYGVSMIHRTLTWPTGSLTCSQMLVHAIAHVGCTDTHKEVCSLWKVTLGEKSLAAPANRTYGMAWRFDAPPTELKPDCLRQDRTIWYHFTHVIWRKINYFLVKKQNNCNSRWMNLKYVYIFDCLYIAETFPANIKYLKSADLFV